MRLRDLQTRADRAAPALRTPAGALSHGELSDRAAALAPAARGRRIAVIGGDVAQAAILLAAADGAAGAVALISGDLARDHLARVLAVAGVDAALVSPGYADRAQALPGLACATTAAGVLAMPRSGPAMATGPEPERTDWLMTTSGTTGTPRMVRHTLAGLTRSTRLSPRSPSGTPDGTPDGGPGRQPVWGLMYDHTRFAGLQVLLQALLSGACLAAPDLSDPLPRQLAFLTDAGCTRLSATPTLWRKLLMTPGAERLPLTQVTLGGEIADQALLAALAQRFPRARVSHVFASTEAGVAFAVHDGAAGFPARYLSEPPGGVHLRVQDGTLWVRNTQVHPAYLGGEGAFGSEGWIDTGDRVTRQGERVLFRGRASGVINVGGSKVHPEEVEQVLLAHPGVAAARVFGRQSPLTGALVAAEVVPADPRLAAEATGGANPAQSVLKADLMAHLRARLDRHAVPVSLSFIAALPLSGSGKIRRAE